MGTVFKPSSRSGALTSRLKQKGFTVEDARIGGKFYTKITSPHGRRWLASSKMSHPINSHEVHCLADNKQLSYGVAESLDITIPKSMYAVRGEVSDDELNAFLVAMKPVIVKPLDSYQSKGVTLHINQPEQLRQALEKAWCESTTAIVQEQVSGEEYRFTVLDGKVVSVLRRERPQVVGDGKSMVAELIAAENEAREKLSVSYPAWDQNLVGDAVRDGRIMPAGERLILSQATMVRSGASIYEVIDETDGRYIELAEKFASEIGAGLLAVDLFIEDHREYGRYWFNECNAAPALKLYMAVRNRDDGQVIDKIVDRTAELLSA